MRRKFDLKNLPELERQTSMLYWFPKIVGLGIPIPRTVIVETPDFDYLEYVDKPDEIPETLIQVLKSLARRVGYPIFLRTDYLSGKHRGAPFVKKEEDLKKHVYMLIEESATAGFFGVPIKAFIIREHLELDWKFKAFNNLPIARERRYFIKDGKVVCHHPYWPEDAITWSKTPLPENWRQLLSELNAETEDEIRLLTSYAEKVGNALKGYWSVDFAHAKNGKWYLIDMARGELSWHPKCSKAGIENG